MRFISMLFISAVCASAAYCGLPEPVYTFDKGKGAEGKAKMSKNITFAATRRVAGGDRSGREIVSGEGFAIKYSTAFWQPSVEVRTADGKTHTALFGVVGAATAHRFTFTLGGGKLRTYRNGVPVQTVDCPNTVKTGGAVKISEGSDARKIALYDKVLTDSEVRLEWDNSFRDYRFDGTVSEDVLNSYLSRAVTADRILTPQVSEEEFKEQLALIKYVGAKYIGRASLVWGQPEVGTFEEFFSTSRRRAAKVRAVDPDIILQAAILECVSRKGCAGLKVAPATFEAFGLPFEDRTFDFDAMCFSDGRLVNFWGQDTAAPDMTKTETRMWFYQIACSYIDAGFEGLHMGQVHMMGQTDKDYTAWKSLLGMVREYGKAKARRHIVLLDAHTHGILSDGISLFDFNAYPLRPMVSPDSEYGRVMEKGYFDCIYGDSAGCVTPSGQKTDSLPYIVEYDNYDLVTDEITWFASMPRDYRAKWLAYSWEWVRRTDDAGWVQPAIRRFCGGVPNNFYSARKRSEASPGGMDDGDAVKAVFEPDFVGSPTPPRLK
ncbi:MAG: hypothetical protein J6U98_02930 [Abditibacteriota bacterium]|nr:hypothetical protein [Abditibacteriota bacterium]